MPKEFPTRQWRLIPIPEIHTNILGPGKPCKYCPVGHCGVCGKMVDKDLGWRQHDAVLPGSPEDTVWKLAHG